ncbi:hypothetical protein R6M67_44190, partial [Streptomyces sp. Wh19]|nr:hypothetical protein [Streptomyces sp. Wh19]
MADAATARLVTTLAAPLDRARKTADAPRLLHWPDARPGSGNGLSAGLRRLLVQRGDTELIAVDPGDPETAPWEEAAVLLAGLHRTPAPASLALPPMRGPAKAALAVARM